MTKKALTALFTLLLATAWLAGCSAPGKPASPGGGTSKIKVVATIFPLADIAKNIGGEKVEVVTLLPAGSSPHTFEVTPEQVKNFSKAQVFIKVGAGLDSFGDKLVESSGNPSLVTVTATENIDLLDSSHQGEGRHGHRHLENKDPHVWLDPVLVKEYIAPQIAGALAEASPENTQYFRGNLDKYCDELDLLHKDIMERTAKLQSRTFIAFHSAWRYFARRYGLRDVAVEEFPSHEPTPQWIAGVIETARASGAKAILAEPQFSTKAAEVIAAEFGAPVLTVDPLGAENIPGYDSYLSMMRSNMKVLEQALR